MKVNYCDELLIFPTVAKKSLKSEFIGFEKHGKFAFGWMLTKRLVDDLWALWICLCKFRGLQGNSEKLAASISGGQLIAINGNVFQLFRYTTRERFRIGYCRKPSLRYESRHPRIASKILNSTIETRTGKRDIQIYVFDKKAIIQRLGNCLYSLFPIRPSYNLLSDERRSNWRYLFMNLFGLEIKI